MEELYFFRRDNPSLDMQPTLNKLSVEFRNYIDRGLAKAERRFGSGAARFRSCYWDDRDCVRHMIPQFWRVI